MRGSVYVETTIISYLAARPSKDLLIAASQAMTHEWWLNDRPKYTLFVSDAVIQEASGGDPSARDRRLALLRNLPVLNLTEEAYRLARRLLDDAAMPAKAAVDALHVAVAAIHRVDFLLTWNCAHLAGARVRPRIEFVCETLGLRPPVICTPHELMG